MSCDCGCGSCDGIGRVHLRANVAGVSRRETFKGREHLVVPVVMLRQTVVNGAFVPADQLNPAAWNGTPVTVNHPEANGQTITANSPAVLEKWSIGLIFNAEVKGDRLVAEAWIDIETAETHTAGLIERLESGEPMDVSTGYFPTAQKKSGRYNGKSYTEVHTELKPDHLALLPDDVGACSWEDGCGIRANRKGGSMADQNEQDEKQGLSLLSRLLFANRRGNDDDRRQIVADLISSDDTPFVPDDMYSLMEMSSETLSELRDKFLKKDGEGLETNSKQEGNEMSDDKNAAGKTPAVNSGKIGDMTADDFAAMVANTAKEAATTALTEHLAANKTAELVEKLAANEQLGLTAEELKAMPLSALEKLAANAAKSAPKTQRAAGDFSGRALRTQADDGNPPEKKFPGMHANSVTPFKAEADEKKEA